MKFLRSLTFDEASDLCEEIGTPAPYPNHARDLKNGTAVRCRKDQETGRCFFELCEYQPGDLWKQGFSAGEISRITGFPLAS